MTTPMPMPPSAPDPGGKPLPGYVNVIFMGQFLFVEGPNMIEVLVPNLGAEHVYRAGLFLSHVSLNPKPMSQPYVLTGVDNGGKGFDRAPTNPVLSGYNYRSGLTQDEVYARFILPRPMEICSLRPTKNPIQANDPSGLVNKQKFPGVQILRYSSTDLNQVCFSGHPLPEAPGNHEMQDSAGKVREFVNLHVIAEPEIRAISMAHPSHAFMTTIDLIEGLQGTITITGPSTMLEEIPPDDPARGYSGLETIAHPIWRQKLTFAGREWRLGHSHTPDPSGFLDDPPNACLPVVIAR
jgi:hypothetical protein